MKKVFYVLQFCILVLCGCGSDSEEDEELSGGKGLAPNEIVGKTLTLKKKWWKYLSCRRAFVGIGCLGYK